MTKFGRRKFLSTGLIASSATVGSSIFLQSCAPDFAAIDAALQSKNQSDIPSNSSSNSSQPANKEDSTETNSNAASSDSQADTIKVGLLHSLSGSIGLSEIPLIDAELLAIAEINASGGILGKQLVPLKEDGASDWPTFAEKAEKLIDSDVSVIFGGLTSESRKAILPVVTAKNSLLWYPGAYEGQECSGHIFYAGATASQQIVPAIKWMIGNRGKAFFLVSSNARVTHEIAKAQIKAYGGKVAGEAFVPLVNGENADMSPLMSDIKTALPEGGIIFNALVGSHNRLFFRALNGAGLTSDRHLVMSVRMSETEVSDIGANFLAGHYAAWNYFQTIESPENKAWVDKFKGRYGPDRVIGAPMASAYAMVHLWAKAVAAAQTTQTEAVRQASYGQTFQAPEGSVTIRPNHHTTKALRIAKVRADGLFEILYTDKSTIEPEPWSQALAASKGVVCDWSDPEKGGKYRLKAVDENL